VRHWLKVEVVVVTEPHDVDARVQAITAEADVAIAPVAPGEMVARVASSVRRNRRAGTKNTLSIGDMHIHTKDRHVTRRGQVVHLTGRELDVLLVLVEEPGRAVTKQELLQRLWREKARTPNAVEAQISGLRKKLHQIGPAVIHTVHGVGYAFEPVIPALTPDVESLTERERRVREREAVVAKRVRMLRDMERRLNHPLSPDG